MLFLLPKRGSVLMFAVVQKQTNKPGVGKKKKYEKRGKNYDKFTGTLTNFVCKQLVCDH